MAGKKRKDNYPVEVKLEAVRLFELPRKNGQQVKEKSIIGTEEVA